MTLSAAMMLRTSLGLEAEAERLERAVLATIDDGISTGDLNGGSASTAEFGEAVVARLGA